MTEQARCLVKGCDLRNHDLCLCGHDRMDHLELPRADGGGCWSTGTDCWPRCLTFEHAIDDEEPGRFFEAWREEFGMEVRPDQKTADAFRSWWLTARSGRRS